MTQLPLGWFCTQGAIPACDGASASLVTPPAVSATASTWAGPKRKPHGALSRLCALPRCGPLDVSRQLLLVQLCAVLRHLEMRQPMPTPEGLPP